MRIHVIDDDAALCRSLQIQLEGEGHSVDLAQTGAKGLAQIESANPDIIFLDLNLPGTVGQPRMGLYIEILLDPIVNGPGPFSRV